MPKIITSIIFILFVIGMLIFGYTIVEHEDPTCWQRYADRPCQTTGEILKEIIFK